MFITQEALGIILLYIGCLWWARKEALEWLKRKGPELHNGPTRYYTIVVCCIVGSTGLMLYRIYVDWGRYEEPDPVILVAWIVFLLAQAWIMWHIAPKDFALIRERAAQAATAKQTDAHQPHHPQED